MRILWLCNIMLPMIAEHLHMEASNKEGWLSGLAAVVLERQRENGIELAVAFPVQEELPEDGGSGENGRRAYQSCRYDGCTLYKGEIDTLYQDDIGGDISSLSKDGTATKRGRLSWYAFREDVTNPHIYDDRLELQMHFITKDFAPDVVHCFGTEYPHTLAMCRAFPDKSRILVGIQGLCKVYADAYFADLPKRVTGGVTLRDLLKRDSLRQQRQKFVLRGEMEYEAVMLTGNVTGRTDWDRHYTKVWNPNACYFKMDETLRPDFYTGQWSEENCEPHSIFLSQGDYPIKGLHYMLLALPAIREVFPDVKVYVAGNPVTGEGGLVKRLKISAYGQYLRGLIRRYGLRDRICFLGKLDASQMKQRYLKSNLFVCCSAIENSPNSLGEAMLLGVPCVSADVGGIGSIFTHGKDGILYEGCKLSESSVNNDSDLISEKENLENICRNLANAVLEMFSSPEKMAAYSQTARNHAQNTHEKEKNYCKLMEIYAAISGQNQTSEKSGERSAEPEIRPPQFVFVSNYINHHQIPLCNALYERLEGAFVFIQTEEMEEERVRMGWQPEVALPYMKYYEQEPENCRKLILDAPMVLFGGVDNECYIQERLRSGRPVIRYSERLYKEGQWKAVSPRGLLKKYKDHTRYRKSPVYLLCAGAYVPSDFHIVRAYPGKMLKWGYFPDIRHYDVDELMRGKEPGSILWAARFLDWKHPETALKCACYLKEKGLSFHMNIVGDGEQRALVDKLIRTYGLEDVVTLLGYRSPDEVRGLMERSQIYLATSDRKEGWGAVLNEAMNSGCAVVADHMMGAAPYLIRQGENGFLYEDGKPKGLYELTERLLRDGELCERLGRAAIADMEKTWNADTAAERLLRFCESHETAEEGPCSLAEIVSERKMRCKIL